MSKAKVRLNRAGMKALPNDPGVAADLMRRMGPVLAAAQASAPVVSGAYRDSLSLEMVNTGRVVARVVSDSDHAMAVEASTGNLSRSLNAAGGA